MILKNVHMTETPETFIAWVAEKVKGAHEALHKAAHDVVNRSHAIEPYQAALLFVLAAQYNKARSNLLEIGTRYGYSAAIISQAAPKGKLTTVDALRDSVNRAKGNLEGYENVTCVKSKSWNWLQQVEDSTLNFIFLDGDHSLVERDLPWFDKLKPGGLMLFHDYTPSRFPKVVEAVHMLKAEPDLVFIQAGTDKGIAGVYKD